MNKEIIVGNKKIGTDHSCFIIAEVGINHNGSLDNAQKLIDAAVDAGCDAVKFQAFEAKTMYPKSAGKLDWKDEKGKYSYEIYDNVKSFEMPLEWVPKLIDYCNEKGIIFFSSVCSEDLADFFEEKKVPLLKTTSYAITHLPLLDHIAKKKIPLIISTGGATLEEIKEAYNTIKKHHSKIIILHCIIKYPAPLEITNMNVLDTLKKEFPDVIIGFSDHSAEPIAAPVAAIAKDAKVVEKHITLDKKMKGPDHFFALEPSELKKMVKEIRNAEQTLRSGGVLDIKPEILGSFEKKITKSEEYLKKFAFRSIFAAKYVGEGEKIDKDKVLILRPGKKEKGLAPKHYEEIISGDYVASKNINAEDPVTWDNIKKKDE